MSTTLNREKEYREKTVDVHKLDIHDFVHSASKVIAPFGPISQFAARTPWPGLEDQSFEQVARRMKDICDVDIFPNDSIVQSARDRGEINQGFLEKRLSNWLDSYAPEMPRGVAERYCKTALLNDQLPSNLWDDPELKILANRLGRFKTVMTEKHSVQTYSQRLERSGRQRLAQELNRHMIKWCKLFLDESQAVWSMPDRENGFFHAWLRLVRYDPALKPAVRRKLNEWPKDAGLALKKALRLLDIPASDIQGYLEAHLLALPGWAGMMLWRSQHRANEQSLVTEYLAVRISMEWALINPYLPLPEQSGIENVRLEPFIASWVHWGGLPIRTWLQLSPSEQEARLKLACRFDKMVRNRLWLEAWEKTYEDQLRKMITSRSAAAAEEAKPALAQFAFCIDVRSEPFRRKLEKAGPFATFGTAGFFGLPIETSALGSKHSHSSLPVFLKPQFKIGESTSEYELNHYQDRRQAAHSIGYTFKKMKNHLLAGLLLPEISGPWLSLQTLARSFLPRTAGSAFQKIRKKWLHKPSTDLLLDHGHGGESELPSGFSEEEKVYFARQGLKMMGLTDHFAPLVVICGHASRSTNNPYASSLDCGACGGASSGFNARVLAALCNLPNVRRTLAEEGISIPKETVFAAAEHITTADTLRWLYVPELSEEAREAVDCVQKALSKVSAEASAERIMTLPHIHASCKNPRAEAERIEEDWSEVRPEWGLARNAAFIIGERKLTQECQLDGRVFLHNYNWLKDKDGAILDRIIAGPATVAQWINLQYYASTVAPHYYGSGNKTTQTVTAGIGVMQGNASDLLIGLPWQSVMQSDQEAYHAPLRLLIVIQAPREYIERLLDHAPAFHQKVQNGWVRLASIDPEGRWESWS
ncbi:DUF2309 family protein [Sporolactobacillus sp. THM7-7]|nr:DUF2309 family protein [Sporolactobacillus sp. THM7-7]